MKLTLYLTLDDKPYVPTLTKLLGAHDITTCYIAPNTVTEAVFKSDAIITTSSPFLKMLTGKSKCTVDDYIGSFWLKKDPVKKEREVPVLCIPPLKRLVSTKPGVFLVKRLLTKIFKPSEWLQPPAFKWELCDDLLSLRTAYERFLSCSCIAVDIETSPAYNDPVNKLEPNHIITCVSYSALFFQPDGNNFNVSTIVIPLKTPEHLKWIRLFNDLPQPKVFQNGKYDNLYFLRFGAPVRNWLFDTLEAHHSLFAELPKNLGYQSAFYLREISFWKDEGQTGDLQDLYRYNAKDSFATLLCFLVWLRESPPWAIRNYLIKFPLVYPCLACEVDGLLVDQPILTRLKAEQEPIAAKALSSLQRKVGYPTFNPRSSKQVIQLLHILGCKDLASSDVKALEKAADRHPLIRLITDEITDYRESAKLISTYLEAELCGGKLLYSLNPSGTDTARLASSASALWCGTQLQNLPAYFKQALRAEDGYFLGEGDFKQSESFCTAYLSGDANLLKTVLAPEDFHGTNAHMFFGLSYDEVMEEENEAKKQMVKPFTIRDLSKRVNHGSNYNMGAGVLLVTMGVKNVVRAQRLLGLPSTWAPLKVTAYLIQKFEEAYPTVKTDFYEWIVASVRTKRMLESCLGWTRLCFGTPWSSKPDKNSYIAHAPSNLSVGIINEAFKEIFWKIHVPSQGAFRLKGQIHDSILFAYKEGRQDLVEHCRHLMTRTTVVTDCKGVKREMTIPVDMKAEGKTWATLKKFAS